MSLVPRVLAYTLIPVAAAAVAGLVAATVRPGEKVTSGVRHFAAGIAVMFGMRTLTERLDASAA